MVVRHRKGIPNRRKIRGHSHRKLRAIAVTDAGALMTPPPDGVDTPDTKEEKKEKHHSHWKLIIFAVSAAAVIAAIVYQNTANGPNGTNTTADNNSGNNNGQGGAVTQPRTDSPQESARKSMQVQLTAISGIFGFLLVLGLAMFLFFTFEKGNPIQFIGVAANGVIDALVALIRI